MIDLEAIRARNEERKKDWPYGWAEEFNENDAVDDIDALLVEVARLRASERTIRERFGIWLGDGWDGKTRSLCRWCGRHPEDRQVIGGIPYAFCQDLSAGQVFLVGDTTVRSTTEKT